MLHINTRIQQLEARIPCENGYLSLNLHVTSLNCIVCKWKHSCLHIFFLYLWHTQYQDDQQHKQRPWKDHPLTAWLLEQKPRHRPSVAGIPTPTSYSLNFAVFTWSLGSFSVHTWCWQKASPVVVGLRSLLAAHQLPTLLSEDTYLSCSLSYFLKARRWSSPYQPLFGGRI